MNEAASTEAAPAMKAELENAVVSDADLIEAVPDVAAVAQAETARD